MEVTENNSKSLWLLDGEEKPWTPWPEPAMLFVCGSAMDGQQSQQLPGSPSASLFVSVLSARSKDVCTAQCQGKQKAVLDDVFIHRNQDYCK